MKAECMCGRWMCSRCGYCHGCDGMDDDYVGKAEAHEIASCRAQGMQPEYAEALAKERGNDRII